LRRRGESLKSSEKFLHGIKVLMARNYVENLGEEASKGMREKAKSGIWPSFGLASRRWVIKISRALTAGAQLRPIQSMGL
jgi:hypothetical protein